MATKTGRAWAVPGRLPVLTSRASQRLLRSLTAVEFKAIAAGCDRDFRGNLHLVVAVARRTRGYRKFTFSIAAALVYPPPYPSRKYRWVFGVGPEGIIQVMIAWD